MLIISKISLMNTSKYKLKRNRSNKNNQKPSYCLWNQTIINFRRRRVFEKVTLNPSNKSVKSAALIWVRQYEYWNIKNVDITVVHMIYLKIRHEEFGHAPIKRRVISTG